jgi:hypothetical protein
LRRTLVPSVFMASAAGNQKIVFLTYFARS